MKQKLIKIFKYIGIGIGGLLGLMIIITIFVPADDIEEQDETQDQVVEEQEIPEEIEVIEDDEGDSEDLITVEPQTTPEVTQDPEPEVIQEEQDPTVTYYNVTQVVDGDTVKISMNGTVRTLRLIGLDTPETVDPRKPVQCFGEEASNKAKELLSGKSVHLEYDASQGQVDKYGRTLAYIYTESGIFFNKYMIEQGYAYEYTYDEAYKYQSEFKQAEVTAKANNRGLWSPDTCNGEATSVENENETSEQERSEASGTVYYTSSWHSSQYYYPSTCSAWHSIEDSNHLRSFNSLDELLSQFSRSLSPQCE
jgi:endonuclease YncB( thermonuclease family)